MCHFIENVRNIKTSFYYYFFLKKVESHQHSQNQNVLGQAGPGAAKRGFGYESVNRLKTTCGRPGTRVGYPENPAVCNRDVE